MYEDLDVIAMKAFDDTTDAFIVRTNINIIHAVMELLQLYPDKYIDGYYLKEKNPKLYEEIISTLWLLIDHFMGYVIIQGFLRILKRQNGNQYLILTFPNGVMLSYMISR